MDGSVRRAAQGYSLVEAIIALAIASLAASAVLDHLARAVEAAGRVAEASDRIGSDHIEAAALKHVWERVLPPSFERPEEEFAGEPARMQGLASGALMSGPVSLAPHFFVLEIREPAAGGGEIAYAEAPIGSPADWAERLGPEDWTVIKRWPRGRARFVYWARDWTKREDWPRETRLAARSPYESVELSELSAAPSLIGVEFDDAAIAPILAAPVASERAEPFVMEFE